MISIHSIHYYSPQNVIAAPLPESREGEITLGLQNREGSVMTISKPRLHEHAPTTHADKLISLCWHFSANQLLICWGFQIFRSVDFLTCLIISTVCLAA